MRRLSFKRRRIFHFTSILFIFIAGSIMLFFISFSPVFTELSKSACENHTRSVLYSAALAVSEDENFSLLSETTAKDGRITGISLNAQSANKIRSLFAEKANTMLSSEEYSTFSIPIGNISGIPLLSGRGFKIPLKIVPLGSVDADIMSDFSSAGINQTKHSVYVKASVKVSLMAPFSSATTETTTKIPLTETVVVGDIPNLYADVIK